MIESAQRVPHRRRIRSSTKIAIGFVVVIFAGWAGYRAWSNFMVSNIKLGPITPKQINLVAISPGAGYRILVANGIAQLAEISGGFDAPNPEDLNESTDIVSAKKIPLREMLESLQGNQKGLDGFVMRINDIKEDDLPKEAPVWTAEDIHKAIGGDKNLQGKLEHDINMGLDGTPPNRVLASACINGIVIDTPVPIEIGTGKLVAHVLQPYRPGLIEQVEKVLEERFDADTARPGVYREKAQAVIDDPKLREDVKHALEARISEDRTKDLAAKPTRVLSNAEVILNDDHIESATYRNYRASDKRDLNDITINLTDEGRKRLWKYSHGRSGFQLLLVVNGVAIAAPRISHELSQSDVTVSQLPDESLVKEAVDLMNQKSRGGTSR
jgi:hypothetical protein